MTSSSAPPEDKFFEKVNNPYLAEVLQHPQTIEMREGVLHIRDVEGPKKTESMEMICLRRIYNFLLFHANILQLLHTFGNFLYYFWD